ncbi:DODA-type extradiol aromatic ring-opening family dioxygenase [Maridesulfovibrio sp.]|uniref:DODA-type extradiol aromatic ring-opening family dioxygenase n=1 Tax=Maridesulfovibrio sp. TaxID=2795000 RepID=UPI0039EF84A6
MLGDEGHKEMVSNLRHLAETMPKPSAILVVSAHWEESQPTLTLGKTPPLYYDYYGFPQESYELEYPAPGDDSLVGKIQKALKNSEIESRTDSERGYDHALFIPLLLMYPEANIPCVEMSLIKGLDPSAHIAMGKALSKLEDENILIIGSGFSFHNMRAFFAPDTPETKAANNDFDAWLRETCSSQEIDESEREKRMIEWEAAPHARYCHPREEHLIPLHVCIGATGRACPEVFELEIIQKKASAFRW